MASGIIYGTFADVAEYVHNVEINVIEKSYMGYHAAWLTPEGDIIAVSEHVALTGDYLSNYSNGLTRLVVERGQLGIQAGRLGITDAQGRTIRRLMYARNYTESMVDAPAGLPRGTFRTVAALMECVTSCQLPAGTPNPYEVMEFDEWGDPISH